MNDRIDMKLMMEMTTRSKSARGSVVTSPAPPPTATSRALSESSECSCWDGFVLKLSFWQQQQMKRKRNDDRKILIVAINYNFRDIALRLEEGISFHTRQEERNLLFIFNSLAALYCSSDCAGELREGVVDVKVSLKLDK